MSLSFPVGLWIFQVMAVLATQKIIVGFERAAGLPACAFQSCRLDPRRQDGDDALRDIVLHCENILKVAIVALRPQVVAARPIDQLSADANSVAGATYTAL